MVKPPVRARRGPAGLRARPAAVDAVKNSTLSGRCVGQVNQNETSGGFRRLHVDPAVKNRALPSRMILALLLPRHVLGFPGLGTLHEPVAQNGEFVWTDAA